MKMKVPQFLSSYEWFYFFHCIYKYNYKEKHKAREEALSVT